MICEKCSEPLEFHEVRTLGKATLCPTCYMILLGMYGRTQKEGGDECAA